MSDKKSDRVSEREFRRPDFAGGIPIRLVDGQEWYFAEPRMRLVPADNDFGYETMISVDDGGEFDRLLTEYQSLSYLPPEEFQQFALSYASLEIKIARMMLERNYKLSTSELRELLQFSHDKSDTVAYRIREQVIAIIAGESPKPSGGGCEPSATPPEAFDSTTACCCPTT